MTIYFDELQAAFSAVDITLTNISQHTDQYGRNVLRLNATSTNRRVHTVVGNVLIKHFKTIQELSHTIVERRGETYDDYSNEFVGRFTTSPDERVEVRDAVKVADLPADFSEATSSITPITVKSVAKRKGR